MNELFQIGSFTFRLIYPNDMPMPENLRCFLKKEPTPYTYTYRLHITEQLPDPEGTPILSRPELMVFQTQQGETRLISVVSASSPYALYRELAPDQAEVFVSSHWLHMLTLDPMFTSLLALERRLLSQDGMILHCAYIRNQGEAILFSAPSQTGKSTQGSLWETHRGAETINGDRSLLQKKAGRWHAQGWPVCGTSGICRNISVPIRAIVMLSQGKSNQIMRLSPAQAFSQIYGQITINRWNRQATEQAMDLLEQLISEIPIYHLSCTISEEAVICLEQALYPSAAH